MICKYKLAKLNCSKYCYVSLIIQLNINDLFTHSEEQNNFKQFNLASFNCLHSV